MESVSATLLMFGLILLITSWVVLLITSFKEDFAWGLTTLFLPPLSYIYGIFAWQKTQAALVMAVMGWVFILFSL